MQNKIFLDFTKYASYTVIKKISKASQLVIGVEIVSYEHIFNFPCDLLCFELHLSHDFLQSYKLSGASWVSFLSLRGGPNVVFQFS